MFNALARIEEDEAGEAGPLITGKKVKEKGVRVSFFAATLGISPYLFMREVNNATRAEPLLRASKNMLLRSQAFAALVKAIVFNFHLK